jgi:hypothetical protein
MKRMREEEAGEEGGAEERGRSRRELGKQTERRKRWVGKREERRGKEDGREKEDQENKMIPKTFMLDPFG